MKKDFNSLSWFDKKLFQFFVKYFDKKASTEINYMVDMEVCRRRNKLNRDNPNKDPLSSEYLDIDTVRKEWGLPTTNEMIVNINKKIEEFHKITDKPVPPTGRIVKYDW